MTKLEIILICVSTLSIFFNIGVFLYARNVVLQLLSVSSELGDLKDMADSLAAHTKEVYELEMFYGDDTLQHLMNHARSFNEYLDTFEYIYALTEEDVVVESETKEIEIEPETQN
tara:strand:+ start:1264 stop:1608 length:345 start_codon:yes stop_codon:yes gene_type:complete